LDILRSYTPLVEQASIDEAYMDATELCQKKAALELAAGIRQRIREELGFTVNVGISTNRLLAKMASDFEKPDRTHTLFPEEVEEKMWPLPIGDLYGCGGRTSARLRTLGIQTIGDAAKTPVVILIDNLGEKSGKYIHRAANGLGHAGITLVREDAKSYSNEYTTSSDITQETYEAEYLPLLQHLCDKVAGRLQRDGIFGKTVVVTVKTDDFRRRSAQCRLRDATNRSELLYETAVSLSDKLLLGEKGLFADGTGIRLVGAGVTDLDHGDFRQMSLLDWEPEEEPAADPLTDKPWRPVGSQAVSSMDAEKKNGNQSGSESKPKEAADMSTLSRARRLSEMEARINGRYGEGTIKKGMA
ncbi:MAG: DNA polymerase IV, partial [Lachnospiraceae bacterium]|nr:DNA polymerase IV [Lachnospiraceae bacterium]